MYHYVVRRRMNYLLDRVRRGDFATIISQFTPGAEHWFSGTHALSSAPAPS